MAKLVRFFVCLLMIGIVVKCDEQVDFNGVLTQLESIVDNLKKDDHKESDALNDMSIEDEALSAADDLAFEADLQKLLASNDEASTCRNSDESKCLVHLQKGDCKDKTVQEFCQRTCMKCCADIQKAFCVRMKKSCHKPQHKMRMRHYCPETCKYCGKGLAPAPCVNSKFGCCWDKSTPASAPIGSGGEKCPPCADRKSPVFCKRFENICDDYNPDHRQGRQIRAFCPKTCRLCGHNAKCMDHPMQKDSCPRYKADGLCKESKNQMRYWCPKTCEFCKCKDNPAINCQYLAKYNVCKRQPKQMSVLCPMSCDKC